MQPSMKLVFRSVIVSQIPFTLLQKEAVWAPERCNTKTFTSSNPEDAATIRDWDLKRAKLGFLREGEVKYTVSPVNHNETFFLGS